MLKDKGMIRKQDVTKTVLNFQSSLFGYVTKHKIYRQVEKISYLSFRTVGSTEMLITCSYSKSGSISRKLV